jgi:hypothetical protein
MMGVISLPTVGRTLLPIVLGLLVGLLSVFFSHPKTATATTLPSGFNDELVTSVKSPTTPQPARAPTLS